MNQLVNHPVGRHANQQHNLRRSLRVSPVPSHRGAPNLSPLDRRPGDQQLNRVLDQLPGPVHNLLRSHPDNRLPSLPPSRPGHHHPSHQGNQPPTHLRSRPVVPRARHPVNPLLNRLVNRSPHQLASHRLCLRLVQLASHRVVRRASLRVGPTVNPVSSLLVSRPRNQPLDRPANQLRIQVLSHLYIPLLSQLGDRQVSRRPTRHRNQRYSPLHSRPLYRP